MAFQSYAQHRIKGSGPLLGPILDLVRQRTRSVTGFWTNARRRRPGRLLPANWAVVLAGLIALLAYLFTLQHEINGTYHPYKTDVGEIQNALPRWGTLHDSGYPLYALLGSAFVNALRPLGIPPAAGASLYSAVWGAIAAALLARLALELGASPLASLTAGMLFGLSTSMWVDASIAEVHTMTMALTLAALLAAVRFRRTGERKALYWLAFLAGQGLAHQRSFALLAPGLLLLVLPHWRLIRRRLPAVIGLGLLGPLTYAYMPLQGWAGVTWQFEPITWESVLVKMADIKADRITALPQTIPELWMRLIRVIELLDDDLPSVLLLAGLAGLLLLRWNASRAERWGLFLCWLPYLLVSLIIWEGRISDALLAAKMPVVAMAVLGLALLAARAHRWRPALGRVTVIALISAVALLYLSHRPGVLALTQDDEAQKWIDMADQLAPDPDGRPTTFIAFWGDQYWQLAYAQAFEGRLPHLSVVHHNQDLTDLAHDHRLVAFGNSFRTKSISWWEETCTGWRIYLSSVAPGIVEIKTEPQIEPTGVATDYLHLFDWKLAVREVTISQIGDDRVRVGIAWQALSDEFDDYGTAVQIGHGSEPCALEAIMSQAAYSQLAGGSYPSSRMVQGEVVWDQADLATGDGAQWLCIRTLVDRDGQLRYRDRDRYSLPLQVGTVSSDVGLTDAE